MPRWKAEKKILLDRKTFNDMISRGGKYFEDWQPILD